MQGKDDILSLLREKSAQAAREAQRGVILQPGAIGDCILTLPLANFMKEHLGLGAVDIIGHTEYIGIFPGRTCVDGIRSIDSVDLHRLFAEVKMFDLADRDPLINAFADYTWIATFLGEPNSNFEQNLIFTVNCSRSAEVVTLSTKAPEGFCEHITDFYTRQFIDQSGLSLEARPIRSSECLIKTTEADKSMGKELLKEIGLGSRKKVVIIQPGSGGTKKCWHISNFLAVAKELILQGTEVVFLLGPAELERFSEATIKNIRSVARCLTGLSLPQVVGLLSCIDGFIGNDSGLTHLAAALGVRTLAIFGPTNPAVYRPLGPDVNVLTSKTATFTKKSSPKVQRQLMSILLP